MSRREPPKRYWTIGDRPKSRLAILGIAALLLVCVAVALFFLLIYGW